MAQINKKIVVGGGLWHRNCTLPAILIVMALMSIIQFRVLIHYLEGNRPVVVPSIVVPSIKDDDSDWEIKPLNIMKSRSQGFRPVYIYSNVTPNHMDQYSQEKQDQIILALTKANDDRANRSPMAEPHFFVDLAANDALYLSNTFVLEKNGWEGVCIEANPEYWYGLASFRTCTIIGAAVGGKPEDDGLEVNFALKGVFGVLLDMTLITMRKTPQILFRSSAILSLY